MIVHFTGRTEAICLDDTPYDVVIGNIDGSKLPDMSHFCAATETRSQAKESEKEYRKLKVPDQIINESKEEFKKAQAIDANLESIRRRVEKGTSRQRSGKGAIRKRFPLQKPEVGKNQTKNQEPIP